MNGSLTTAWRAIGHWRWPTLAVVAYCIVVTPVEGPISPRWQSHDERMLGSDQVTLDTLGHLVAGNDIQLRLKSEAELGALNVTVADLPVVTTLTGDAITVELPDNLTVPLVIMVHTDKDQQTWHLGRDWPHPP
ncbi:MAG: hypothetical protein AAF525_12150 [Pseudomonadota bacterium]